MTTLREAAQQALEALKLAKPEVQLGEVDAAITALRAALAEPEQEPVAWRNKETGEFCTGGVLRKDWARWMPLYTAPPHRKPLTNAEMRECAQAMDAEPLAEGWSELAKFARAIEAAHGITGPEDKGG